MRISWTGILRLILAGAVLLGPGGVNAANLGTITVPPVTFRSVEKPYPFQPGNYCNLGQTDEASGLFTLLSQLIGLGKGSPAFFAAPIFNSGNKFTSSWGRGWSSDLDHSLSVGPGGSLTWQDGLGNRLTFSKKTAGSSAPIPLSAPIDVFSQLSVTALSATGGYTSAELREPDGTVRLFTVAESSTVLRLSRLNDRNGSAVLYTRGSSGRLARVTDTHGRQVDLTYNAAGLIKSVTDSGGRVTNYTYDDRSRRILENGPEGSTAYQYDQDDHMARITFPNGGVRSYTYDSQGRVTSQDEGSGNNRTTYTYYVSSTVVTDVFGHSTTYEFVERQGLKKVSKVVDPAGGTMTFTYDSNFNLASETDPLGRTVRYIHDNRGNVIQVERPSGAITRASYEPTFNQPVQVIDSLNHATDLTYNPKGDLTKIASPLAFTRQLVYDEEGHVVSLEDPSSHLTQFSYNPTNGALAASIDPINRTTAYETNPLSQIIRYTDPANKQTQFEYDVTGNLTRTINALNGITQYQYSSGRGQNVLTKVTDALNHATSFGYDPQGRPTSVTNAAGQKKIANYDAAGRLSRITNARGQATNYNYDVRSRLQRKGKPEGSLEYEYDAAGNLTRLTNYNGAIVEMAFDASDRVTQVIQTLPNGYSATFGYSYDSNGNRTGMTTPWGNFSYQYDALDRLISLTNAQNKTFTFEYDSNGRRQKVVYPNGVKTDYTYDQAGQILNIIHRSTDSAQSVGKSTYSYDAAGNRTAMTDFRNTTHTFAYDDLHRLIQANHPATSSSPASSESFSYDLGDNRQSDAFISDYVYDSANRLLSNDRYAYTYDADGNRVSRSDGATFSYTSDNKLRAAHLPGNRTVEFEYDGAGRQIKRGLTNSSGTLVRRYLYDGAQIFAVLDDDNNPVAIVTNDQIGEPLAEYHPQSSDAHYFQTDALGSISVVTDNLGIVLERIDYQSYGTPTFIAPNSSTSTTSSIGTRLAYLGREWDDALQLSNLDLRYYDPEIGEFISEEPNGTDGPNLYTYAFASPLTFKDANGAAGVLGQPGIPPIGIPGSPNIHPFPDTDPTVGPRVASCNKYPKIKIKVYRVYGGAAGPNGKSWTWLSPRITRWIPFAPPDLYRRLAALPKSNTGEWLAEGYITISLQPGENADILFRRAQPIDENRGYWPEIVINDPENQVKNRVTTRATPHY